MSETGVGDSSTAQGVLYDASGNRIASPVHPERIEPLVRFAREQPFTTAGLALAIGYLIGKFS